MFKIEDIFSSSVSFGAEAYAKHGSLDEAGGAHFFFGNHFDLHPGRYLISIHVAKPKAITSPRLVIETVDWSSGDPVPLESHEFPLPNPSDVAVIVLTHAVDRLQRVEVRGWSDVHALELDFCGLVVQKLADAMPENVGSAAGAWLSDRQLFCTGYDRSTPLFLTLSDPSGKPVRLCEFITAGEILRIDGRPLWSAALSKRLMADAHAVLLAAGLDVYVLALPALESISESALLSSNAADASLGIIGSISRLARFREDTQLRLDKIEAELHGALSAMRSELNACRTQTPRLLKAISAANAVAALVSKSHTPDEAEAALIAQMSDDIRSELAALLQMAGCKSDPNQEY